MDAPEHIKPGPNLKAVTLWCPGCKKPYSTAVMVQRIYSDQEGPICPRCNTPTEWDVSTGYGKDKTKLFYYSSKKDRRLAKKIDKRRTKN